MRLEHRSLKNAHISPWKNGGGVTRQLFISPQEADLSLNNFDLRVSSALVDQGGPFSSYEGYDRLLAVAKGGPLQLDMNGQEVQLQVGQPPLSFPGELPVTVQTPSETVVDFNIFLRRRPKWSCLVFPLDQAKEFRLGSGGDCGFFVALSSPFEIQHDNQKYTLEPLDLLVVYQPQENAVFQLKHTHQKNLWFVMLTRQAREDARPFLWLDLK